jgi:serine/threonine protein kinase
MSNVEPSTDPAAQLPMASDRTVDSKAGADAPTQPVGEAASSRSAWPTIPGYEILEEIGRGGMGRVYKARQVKLKRLVAIKMLLAGRYADPEEMARFHREAESIAKLHHPHIVQVFDMGECEGQSFVVLEYVAGGSLSQMIAGKPVPPTEAARLTEVLARAVHAAHERGVVHRDLKPPNVLLSTDGTLKITDFGLAKHLDATASQRTPSGAILGTPGYLAPEQADSEGRPIGPPTDIYALGAILYELLTGQPPFRGPNPLETMLKAISTPPVPPSNIQSGIPPDIETICLKCLEKNPSDRYATAENLASDLLRFQQQKAIEARPPTTKIWRPLDRRRRVLGGLAVILVAAVAAGVWYSYRAGTTAARPAGKSADLTPPPGDAKLGQHAFAILKKYCARCHHDTLSVEDFNVLDYQYLIDPTTGLVVPGDPEKSSIWIRVGIKDDMPPRKIHLQPSPDERQAIRDWIEAGAPPFAVAEKAPGAAARADSIPAAGLAKLREAMKKLAAQILANTGTQPVSVGHFTSTGTPHSTVDVVLETVLSVELEDLRKGIVQPTAPFEIKGDYHVESGKDNRELKELKIIVRLIETQSGDEVVQLQRKVQLDGGNKR